MFFVASFNTAQDIQRSSTEGSSTRIGWKRRSSAESLRYACGNRPEWLRRCTAFTSCQRGLKNIGGIHGTFGAPHHHGVKFIDKDDAVSGILDFRDDFFNLSSNSPRYLVRRRPKRYPEPPPACFQRLGDVSVHDAMRQPFDDSGLADTGFADESRVILGAAAENLD